MNARRDREAIDELRRAIYLAPYEDEPHLLLGRLYQRGGRLSDAIDEFKVAIWCRETAAARLALGLALLDTGERDARQTRSRTRAGAGARFDGCARAAAADRRLSAVLTSIDFR